MGVQGTQSIGLGFRAHNRWDGGSGHAIHGKLGMVGGAQACNHHVWDLLQPERRNWPQDSKDVLLSQACESSPLGEDPHRMPLLIGCPLARGDVQPRLLLPLPRLLLVLQYIDVHILYIIIIYIYIYGNISSALYIHIYVRFVEV